MATPQRLNIPTKSLRETPRCATCKQPRKGHPRSGCPSLSAPNTPRPPSRSPYSHITVGAGGTPRFTSEETAVGDEAEKRRRRSPTKVVPVAEPTLSSLSTDANEVLERLKAPGIFNDGNDDDEDIDVRVAQWQETLRKPRKHRQSYPFKQLDTVTPRKARPTPPESRSLTPRAAEHSAT